MRNVATKKDSLLDRQLAARGFRFTPQTRGESSSFCFISRLVKPTDGRFSLISLRRTSTRNLFSMI
jgi:hypothetical protein